MKRKGIADVEDFRKLVLQKTGVASARGNTWPTFAGRDRAVYRFAYSGIDRAPDQEGMKKLGQFLLS